MKTAAGAQQPNDKGAPSSHPPHHSVVVAHTKKKTRGTEKSSPNGTAAAAFLCSAPPARPPFFSFLFFPSGLSGHHHHHQLSFPPSFSSFSSPSLSPVPLSSIPHVATHSDGHSTARRTSSRVVFGVCAGQKSLRLESLSLSRCVVENLLNNAESTEPEAWARCCCYCQAQQDETGRGLQRSG